MSVHAFVPFDAVRAEEPAPGARLIHLRSGSWTCSDKKMNGESPLFCIFFYIFWLEKAAKFVVDHDFLTLGSGFFCRPESVAFGMSRWEACFSLLVSG